MRQQEIKRLQSIADKLQSLFDDLQEQFDAREEYYDNRSEEWQESEKGDAYAEETYSLEEDKDKVEYALSEIQDILDKYN